MFLKFIIYYRGVSICMVTSLYEWTFFERDETFSLSIFCKERLCRVLNICNTHAVLCKIDRMLRDSIWIVLFVWGFFTSGTWPLLSTTGNIMFPKKISLLWGLASNKIINCFFGVIYFIRIDVPLFLHHKCIDLSALYTVYPDTCVEIRKEEGRELQSRSFNLLPT